MSEASGQQPAPPLELSNSPARAESEPVPSSPSSPARSSSTLKERFSRFSLLPGRRRESGDTGKRASLDGGASSADTSTSRTNSMPAAAGTPASSVENEPFQSIRGGSAKDKERADKERAQRAAEQAHQKRLTLARRMQSDLRAAQVETPEERGRYGDGVPAAGWANDYSALVPLESIDAAGIGESIVLRARIHAKRTLSPHLAFLFLRQQTSTLQAVVAESRNGLSLHAAKWIERLPVESIVFVRGTLAAPRERVLGATIHDVELQVTDCFLVSRPTIDLPFTVYEADRAPLAGHADKTAKHSESDADDDDDAPSDPESPRHSRHLERSPDASPKPSRLAELAAAPGSEQPRSSVSSRRRSAHGLPGAPPPATVSKRTRLSNRILDIRSPASQAIFRINSRVSTQFRASLLAQGFLEIHTPKLQAGSSESGSSVFQLDYFGRPAFLAQSPQLYKQMAISADLQRVFEIGPVFRAENSNTARHLTEYTGLDLEMQIITDYHEAMRVIDTMLKSVFSALQTHCKREIELVQRHWPHEDLVWLDETPVIEFREGVKMLVESGWKEENGEPPAEDEDLSTRGEARLCELVKQKYKTDYFILDKFPASVRPFYTHLDPENPRFTNSFDILLRGTEICTGGQRIHDARKLEARIREAGVDARSLDEYMEAFRLGVSPHAGCGIGLERILTTFLGLGDVRWSTLFFRDPKSLPLDHRPPPLRHPEADTLAAASRAALAEHDMHGSPENAPAPAPLAKTPSASGEASTPAKPLVVAQPEPEGDSAQLADGPASKWPLEKLIANYGDSSNTSWLDTRFKVWRHDASGGAVGFVKRGKFAIVVGNPLCDHTQYRLVIDAFLAHLREKEKLKPIWLLIGEEVEHILGGRLDWSSLTCVVEQRVPKEGRAAAIRGGDIEKKLRKAEREDLHIDEYGFRDEIPQDVKAELEKRIEDWKKSREGKQLHLTMVDPWQDEGHRAYYVTRSKDKKIQCLVVLAQLSPANGFQIKWALDFPGAITGAIEYTIVHAVSEFGSDSFTFGASAAPNFHTVHNLGGLRVRALSKTYAAISAAAGLGGKNDFRKKIGARDEPLFIAFPRHGLRHGGVRAIMNFFEE